MRLEEERKDVRDVLAQCELHWLVGRIPEAKVDEMRDELHPHLREATRDGKPVGSVVGDDVFAFADSWARENRPSWSLRERLMEFSYLFTVMAAVGAAVLHLVRWDAVAQVRWFEIVYLLAFTVSIANVASGRAPVTRPWWVTWSVAVAASVTIIVVAWGLSVLTTGSGNGVFLEWPWYATVALAAIAVVLGKLRK